MDFALSPQAAELRDKVADFIATEIAPAEAEYAESWRKRDGPWVELPVIEELKRKARDAGLWNFCLPPAKADVTGYPGLSNVDYAPLAELMGRYPFAPEVFNCNAPDTGNARSEEHTSELQSR